MRIRITAPDAVYGKVTYTVGEEHDVPDEIGNALVCAGQAQRVGGKADGMKNELPPEGAPQMKSPENPDEWIDPDDGDTDEGRNSLSL